MKYFKVDHGKWYTDNLLGHIQYGGELMGRSLITIGRWLNGVAKHIRKVNHDER